MSLNKKISVAVLAIGLVIIGWIAWDKFLNIGIIAIKGPAPFSVKIDGGAFSCTTETCETKFAPGEYDLLIQKDGYVDISQKIILRRAEKLIINAELKKKISFNEFGPRQSKHIKLLGTDLPLEISVSDGLRQEYDKLFEIVRGIKSPKNIILRKTDKGSSLTAIVYTSDGDRTYFAAPDQKNLVNFGKRLNGPAAIVSVKPAVVFLDSKSYKNQALMIWNIGSAAPAVITYFQIPISGDSLTVSGDGKFVFVLDKDPRGNNKIYKIDIENKSKELIAEGAGISRIAPSSDGKFVLFKDNAGYYIVDAASRAKRLVEAAYTVSGLYAWTSGDKIIFVYMSYDAPAVSEYDTNSGEIKLIYELRGFDALPSKIDHAETKEYSRVMMLFGEKIYNLDYLK